MAPLQYPETDTGPLACTRVRREQTASVPVPLMTGNAPSHNSGILASVDNPVSCAQADGNDNMSSAPSS